MYKQTILTVFAIILILETVGNLSLQDAYAGRPIQHLVISLFDNSGQRLNDVPCIVETTAGKFGDITNNHGTVMFTLSSTITQADVSCKNPTNSNFHPFDIVFLSGPRTAVDLFFP